MSLAWKRPALAKPWHQSQGDSMRLANHSHLLVQLELIDQCLTGCTQSQPTTKAVSGVSTT